MSIAFPTCCKLDSTDIWIFLNVTCREVNIHNDHENIFLIYILLIYLNKYILNYVNGAKSGWEYTVRSICVILKQWCGFSLENQISWYNWFFNQINSNFIWEEAMTLHSLFEDSLWSRQIRVLVITLNKFLFVQKTWTNYNWKWLLEILCGQNKIRTNVLDVLNAWRGAPRYPSYTSPMINFYFSKSTRRVVDVGGFYCQCRQFHRWL